MVDGQFHSVATKELITGSINAGMPNINADYIFYTGSGGELSILRNDSVYIVLSADDSWTTLKTEGKRFRILSETGMVLPLLTTTERDLLSPVAGTIIYNTTTNKLNFYNGSAWEAVTSA